MSKKKKKKKKNKGSTFVAATENSTIPNNISDQVIQNTVESHPSVVNTPTEDPTAVVAHKAIRKDLIRIVIISLVMLVILAGGVVIRSQTSWLSKGADSIYRWMRLGE